MLTNEERKHIEFTAKAHTGKHLTDEETLIRLRNFAIDSKLAEVLPLLGAGLAKRLEAAVARWPALTAVGYWCPKHSSHFEWEERLPHPKNLVDPSWRLAQRRRMLAYLQSGRTFCQWRGLSYCRFACGIDVSKMGSRCVTDGVWVWPEGLAHYVECQDVILPPEFVSTMINKRWKIPKTKALPTCETHGQPDYALWISWAESQRETVQLPD